MDYGIQLYSVRDEMNKDVRATLAKMAEIGYKMVEFAGFYNYGAEEIIAMLKENGLQVSGIHTHLPKILQDIDAELAYQKAIGNKNIILASHDLSTQAKIDEFVALVNEWQPKLEAQGFTLAYHNHSSEFLPNEDGAISFDQMVEKTNILLEIDTFWAYVAGKDPIAVLEQNRDRIRFIHLKDGTADGVGFPLGMGTAPAAAVYQKAVELGIPMVVESETQKPDGFTEASICMDFLKKMEK